MKKNALLIFTAVCVLLAGCTPKQPVPDPASSPETTAPSGLSETTAPAETDAEPESETAAAGTTEAADSSAAEPQSSAAEASAAEDSAAESAPFSLDQIYDENFAALRCSGRIIARDGLNLRSAPDAASVKLMTMDPETEAEILGFVRNGDVSDCNNRWLKLRVNGTEGFALAEYVAAECTTPAAELSEQERGTLGMILYYQALHLYPDYHRHGGPLGTYTDQFREGYCRVLSESTLCGPLCLENLKKEFYRYFSAGIEQDLDLCYTEDSGKLYVMVGYGDNVALDYVQPALMTKQSDTELGYDITVHHYPEFADADFPEWDHDTFRIVYEDGVWKTAEIKEEY